jgi:hypothetical protein
VHLCVAGPSPPPNPRRFRLMLWHTPAGLCTAPAEGVVCILDIWPTGGELRAACRGIALMPDRVLTLRPDRYRAGHPGLHTGPHRDRTLEWPAAPAIHTNPKFPSTVAQERPKPARRRKRSPTKDQG